MPYATPFDVLFCCCHRPREAVRGRAAPPADNSATVSLALAVLVTVCVYASVIIVSEPGVQVSSFSAATDAHESQSPPQQQPIPFCDENRAARIQEWLAAIEAQPISTSMSSNRLYWYETASGATVLDWSTAERMPRVWDRRYVDICLQRDGAGGVVVTGPRTRYTVTAHAYAGV